jgi:SSS family solute:Na+ symporter/sodium/proline symporter
MTGKLIVLGLFAVMIVIIGILGLRRTKSFSDFFLGGGTVGPWMTAFTYGAAYFSAVLFIGFAGKIGWEFGLSGLWIGIGNALVGVLAVWWIMGNRIKTMAVETGSQTMADYFERRYDSRFLNLYTSICIFIFFIPYTAAVYMGLSYLFQANFNIDYTTALFFMGGFTAFYMVMGGYRSMTMIDVAFGIIMTAGVLVLIWNLVGKGGGFGAMASQLEMINPKLAAPVGPPGIWPLLSLVFLTSVAPFAMPQLVQKFYAVKDRRSIRIGMVASTVFSILISGVAYFAGATTRIFMSPDSAPAAFKDGKPVFDALMPELLTKVVPPALSTLILLLVLAASMSTLAALVLISSSSVAKDVYARFINRGASDRRLTLLMRFGNAFFICLSILLAYFQPATIVAILAISWGAIGSAFLGPFVWGLLLRRTSKTAALASSFLGLGTCLVLSFMKIPPPQAGTIGMMVSLVVAPMVSLVVPRRNAA